MEQTNSADLEALLLLDFQSQESGWAEMGEILRAAEILAERSPQQDSAGADRAWETFLEKYLPFSDGSSLYETAEAPGASALAVQPVPTPSLSLRRRMRRLALWGNHPVRRRILQTAACLALCLLLTGGLLLAFDPGARAAFSGWVRELCGDHFEYHYEARGETAGPKADQTAIYRPTWVPEGYRLTNISDIGNGVAVLYDNPSGNSLVFQYFPASSEGISIYMEDPPEAVTIHGSPADLYLTSEEGNANGLIWGDTEAELLMFLFSDLSREDLLRTAESIQPISGELPPNRPLWVPEDYALQSSGSGVSSIHLYYSSKDGCKLQYTYDTAFSSNREQSWSEIQEASAGLEPEEVLINGLPAQLYRQADGTGHLVWVNGHNDLYWISGSPGGEELLKMAESVIMGF